MEEISLRKKIVQSELTYDYLRDEVHILYEEKNELQQRIDKAIEYIETLEKREAYKIENNENGVPELKVDNEEYLVLCKYNKLLNILKGDYDESNISQL